MNHTIKNAKAETGVFYNIFIPDLYIFAAGTVGGFATLLALFS